MYGFLPEPTKVTATVNAENKQALGGKATLKDVTIKFGPEGTPPVGVLFVYPNQRKGKVPTWVAINFCGNHTAIADPAVSLPKSWCQKNCPGVKDEHATEEGRGKQADVWNLEMIIDRGYAIAMYYYGDVDPDKHDFTDGVHPHFLKPGQKQLGKHDWGSIAAWAYGIHRVVDYVLTEDVVDSKRIACVGHSRLGKTVLLAAAMDDRIALAIPHQAGCGGTAPSRVDIDRKDVETIRRINTVFPHWFCDNFVLFNETPDKLPFDQHCLLALCAPRPVLYSNAVEDQWANPDGQFEMLKGAAPVYALLGTTGLEVKERPASRVLLDSKLGYFIRPGKHSMDREDWEIFLDYADKQLK